MENNALQEEIVGKVKRFMDSKKPKSKGNSFSADSIELEGGRIIGLDQVGDMEDRPYSLSFRKGRMGSVAFLVANKKQRS